MKLLVIPVVEEKTSFKKLNYFNPKSEFDIDWCLDLHGFLDRDQFDARLDEINQRISKVPLLSRRIGTFANWSYGIFSTIMVIIIIYVLTSARRSLTGPAVSIVLQFLVSVGFIAVKAIVEDMRERRAKKFTATLNVLLKEYNKKDFPISNWKLVWRPVMTHFDLKMKSTSDGNVSGKATPKYIEQAEIVLEISDSLSDLTTQTVKDKLDSKANHEMTMNAV
ncbi:16225_t:CDS:1 [Acaulospora morrowiae]|uniref:16225_t:CDS:1 n=1 Tax=Acaulospora morrowiae TaxID=94023 RepID=A0A9N9D733_9GLOM|nr:16225_t:CDS:1 [Acaulospora morrowiae]